MESVKRDRVKERAEKHCKIDECEGFRCIGIKERFSQDANANFDRIHELFKESKENGIYDLLLEAEGEYDVLLPNGVFGAMGNIGDDGYDYYLLVRTDEEPSEELKNNENFVEIIVPTAKWAVFECIGDARKAFEQKWRFIYNKWFPSNYYEEVMDAIEIEIYPEGDRTSESYSGQIWVPIKERKASNVPNFTGVVRFIMCTVMGLVAGWLAASAGGVTEYTWWAIGGAAIGAVAAITWNKRIKQRKALEEENK